MGCAEAETGNWSTVDTTIALQNMVIASWALSVGFCWLGAFREGDVKQLLSIPDDWKVGALVTFGYPAEGENRFPANFQDMRERLTAKKLLRKS